MNAEARKEIRRVLMGKTMLTQDGRLSAMKAGDFRIPLGVTDGAASVRFLGILRRGCRLELSCSPEEGLKLAKRRMQSIGRGLILAELPDSAACLIRYVLTKPAVLVYEKGENGPLLTAWAGRGLMGLLSARRAVKSFLRDMPAQMSVAETLPKEAKKKKLSRKEKRLARKNKAKAQDADAGKAAEPGAKGEE